MAQSSLMPRRCPSFSSDATIAIRYTNPDMEMPPKGKLAANEIEELEPGVTSAAITDSPMSMETS